MFKSCKCCKEISLLKILPDSKSATNYLDKDTLRIANIVSSKEYDEYVVLHSSMYKAIFGEKKAEARRAKKQLSVVKICYEGRSIHRAYRSIPAEDLGNDYVGLTPNSIYELCRGSSKTPKKVYVSKRMLVDVLLAQPRCCRQDVFPNRNYRYCAYCGYIYNHVGRFSASKL